MRNGQPTYPLLLGGGICTTLIALVLLGPALAPKDPLVGATTIWVDGRVYGPSRCGRSDRLSRPAFRFTSISSDVVTTLGDSATQQRQKREQQQRAATHQPCTA